MTWEPTAYFLVILATLFMSGILAWYAWKYPPQPGVRAFGLLILAAFGVTLMEVLSMSSTRIEAVRFWFNARFLFIALIPVIFFIFSVRYYGHSLWLNRLIIWLLLLVPFITQFMVWMNSILHLWVIREVQFNRFGSFWIAEVGERIPGIWYYVHSFYGALLMLGGIVVILMTAWKGRRASLGQSILLAAGAVVGVIVTIIPTFGLFPDLKFNIFIPSIGIALLLFSLAIFRFKLLSQAPQVDKKPVDGGIAEKDIRSLALFLVIFVLMVSGIASIGYFSYRAYAARVFDQTEEQLTAVAALKVNGVMQWREERYKDAVLISTNQVFMQLIQDYLSITYTPEAAGNLQRWLDDLRKVYEYDSVIFIDLEGRERIKSPAANNAETEHILDRIDEVVRSRNVEWIDLHKHTDESIHLSMLVPIFKDADGLEPLGVLVLDINPETWLYPYLNEWPGISYSAETLLVRREGNDALFLTPLRFDPNAALNLQIPLSNTDVLAVQGVLGSEGIVEGVDYRDVEVLGVVQPVDDSPWILITRIDTNEIKQPLRERLFLTLIMYGILILGSGSVLAMLWNRSRLRFFSAQLRVTEALRESDEKFSKAFQISPDVISITRLSDGRIVSVNPSFERILGYSAGEVVGKTIEEIGIYVNIEDRLKLIEGLKEKGAEHEHDARFRAKDGSIKHAILAGAITEIGGEPHVIISARDITERKKIEQELTESEKRYRLIAENTADVIWVMDVEDQKFTYISPSIYTMRGLTSEEAMAQSIEEILPPGFIGPFQEMFKDHLSRFVEGGCRPLSFVDEIDQLHKDGSIVPSEITTKYFLSDLGRIEIIGVSRDISQRRAAQQEIQVYSEHLEEKVQERTRELRETQEKLVRQERLAALGQLAGTIAHELRNPLGVISNAITYLEMIQSKAEPKVQEYLQIIRSETRTSERIIAELLDFTRMQTAERGAEMLADIVRSAIARNPAPESISVVLSLPEDLPPVYVNARQIEQVLGNLLTNAYQAMPEGGSLTIQVERGSKSGKVSKEIKLMIKDSGLGIAQDTIKKIFEPLFTTRAKGIGLGLSISKKLVEANQGRIDVVSKPGRGSIFSIYLPVFREEQ